MFFRGSHRSLSLLAALWAVVCFAAPAHTVHAQDEVEITSSFTPPTVREGRESRYTITIRHTTDGTGRLSLRPQVNAVMPSVAGLDTDYIGPTTSTQTTFSNVTGTRRILTITLNYRARADRPGAYSIPAFELTYQGKDYRVPPATLDVVDAGADTGLDQDEILFLDLLLPEQKVFVGQTIKATLQLYALDRIPNIRSNYPVKIGDAFAEGTLSDSQTRSRGRSGRYNYNIYSRPLTLTPLKSGVQKLVYEMEVQALLPTDGDLFGDPADDDPAAPFNDPLFRRFNFQLNPQMQYQNIVVSTDTIEIDVQPLPPGRPEAFSGAIGEFSLKAFPDSNSVRAGDPITMRLQLAGQGNFPRILPPELDFGEDWRTYEPEVDFKQGDALGFSGIKTFDYTLIPLDDAIEVIPEISISYFDPKTERYEILSSGEVPITVRENPDLPEAGPADPPASEVFADSSEEPEGPAFFQLRLDPGPFASSLRPLLKQPWFLAAQGLPALALVLFVAIRRRQIRIENDENLRRRQAIDQRLQALGPVLGEHARAGRAGDFYHQAIRALRLVLAKRFGARAEAATPEEIRALARELPAPEPLREQIEGLLRADESLNYARAAADPADLNQERQRIETLIAGLEALV